MEKIRKKMELEKSIIDWSTRKSRKRRRKWELVLENIKKRQAKIGRKRKHR